VLTVCFWIFIAKSVINVGEFEYIQGNDFGRSNFDMCFGPQGRGRVKEVALLHLNAHRGSVPSISYSVDRLLVNVFDH